MVSLTDGETTEKYAYDKRGNLTEHLRNGALVNQYLYGALNRLEKAVNAEGIQASYQYNGLGYRTGKRIKESLPDPEKQIRYTIDLTRQYHNLLAKEEEGEREYKLPLGWKCSRNEENWRKRSRGKTSRDAGILPSG